MASYSKFNPVYLLQRWMDSVPGQTFMNYAYSWGAAIVILGTLFKLTHLPGANLMLFIGMGTEVFVFFISAFDRPFDKTADGKDIPTHLTEEYLETGRVVYGGPAYAGGELSSEHPSETDFASTQGIAGEMPRPGGVVVIGSPAAAVGQHTPTQPDGQWVAGQQESAPGMAEAQAHYVEELEKLTETLARVAEQSERLTRDSEEMENLNRTLTGICKVYEMQLKGASQQIGTIDQINEQSRRMAEQIEQLNKIYTRMIEAMTVNMKAAAPGQVSEQA